MGPKSKTSSSKESSDTDKWEKPVKMEPLGIKLLQAKDGKRYQEPTEIRGEVQSRLSCSIQKAPALPHTNLELWSFQKFELKFLLFKASPR